MKLFFSLFLLTLQLQFFLVTGKPYTEGETHPQNDQIAKKSAVYKDVLSKNSCRYIKKNGYCKNVIKRKLCYSTCRCRNKLSSKCCETIKSNVKCKTPWSIRFCRYTCDQCSRTSCDIIFPLGMKSGAIPDSRITASSMYDRNHLPARGRLHIKASGSKVGAWCTRPNNAHQWLQVDLGEVTKVTHIATQGRQDLSQWVRSYRLEYSLNGRHFTYYRGGTVLRGNSDRNTVVKHALNPPIIARFIRVRPKTWYRHISMRMELYGCI